MAHSVLRCCLAGFSARSLARFAAGVASHLSKGTHVLSLPIAQSERRIDLHTSTA